MGYANYKTWAMSTLQLHVPSNSNAAGDGKGMVELVIGDGHTGCDDDADTFSTPDFDLLIDAIRKKCDLLLPYSMQLLQLVGNDTVISPDAMVPCKQTAQFMKSVGTHDVWKGSKEERKVRKKKKKRKMPQAEKRQKGTQAERPQKKQKTRPYDVEFVSDLGIGLVTEAQPSAAAARQPKKDDADSSTSSDSDDDVNPPLNFNDGDGAEAEVVDDGGDPMLAVLEDLDVEFPDDASGNGKDSDEEIYFDLDDDDALQDVFGPHAEPPGPVPPPHPDPPEPEEVDESTAAGPARHIGPRRPADDDADALEAAGLGFARRPGVCEIRYLLTGNLRGELRYNIMSQFYRAVCPVHSDQCMRRRSAVESGRSAGQGRPIGLLVHWLQTAKDFPTRDEHMRAAVGALEHRRDARVAFYRLHGSQEFAKHERPRRTGEKEDEPQRIP